MKYGGLSQAQIEFSGIEKTFNVRFKCFMKVPAIGRKRQVIY